MAPVVHRGGEGLLGGWIVEADEMKHGCLLAQDDRDACKEDKDRDIAKSVKMMWVEVDGYNIGVSSRPRLLLAAIKRR